MGQSRHGVLLGHRQRIVCQRNRRRRRLVPVTSRAAEPPDGHHVAAHQARADRPLALDLVPDPIRLAVRGDPGGRRQHLEEAARGDLVLLRRRGQERPRGRVRESPDEYAEEQYDVGDHERAAAG